MSEERDYESEARSEGWVPKEEWQGDPESWRDAEEFVKRGEEILPFVQAKNRKLSEQVEVLSKRVEEALSANAEFKQFTDKALQRERQEKERAIAQLEEARKKAISDGDGEAFDKADRKLSELKSKPKDSNEQTPEVRAWLAENTWYTEDRTLQAIADGLSGVLAQERPDLVGKRAFLDELTKRVKNEVPHKFENPNRQRSPTEEHQQTAKPNGKAKTYDNLPSDAKAACDRFVKTIPGFTQEQYLAEYEWD